MKRNYFSLAVIFLILILLISIRLFYSEHCQNFIQYDSLGYYLYLPAHFINHDVEYLQWLPEISEKYNFAGHFYQASLLSNGKYVFFYSMGVAIMEAPFFFIAHFVAGVSGYAQDGFSFPYQLIVSAGLIFYVLIGLIVLRKILLNYFSDGITGWVLLLTTLATNFPQYASVDSGLTHGFLFVLFCLLLFFTFRWHTQPTFFDSLLIGFISGLIIITRVTDALIILVPILWNIHNKESRIKKWIFIKQNPSHLFAVIISGFIVMLPQLIYWKQVTGNFIHKMGSKWDLLLPHYQVLIGWEKGWLIYTPVVALMIAGLFFIKHKDFKRGVIAYFLLNLWIVTGWHEWRYGASYSSRALTQSLAIMSLPLGSFLSEISINAWKKYFLIILSGYLIAVNLFQIWQYNQTIIHYDDMNRKYYAAIYLNPLPSPIDMSLLDTDERIENVNDFLLINLFKCDTLFHLNGMSDTAHFFFNKNLSEIINVKSQNWLKLSLVAKSDWGSYDSYLVTEVTGDNFKKRRAIRLQNGISKIHEWNLIQYYFSVPEISEGRVKVYCVTHSNKNIDLKNFELKILTEK